ncbi:MAG: PAS domain-containing protein [Balneola sp.]
MSKEIRGRFSKKSAYLIGLSTVILLTLFNQFLIQRILNEQKFDATVINLAGRQRMLSQQITKEALLTVEQKRSLDFLKQRASQWDQVHKGLQLGNEKLGLPELKSEAAKILFTKISPFQEAISKAILPVGSVEELAGNLDLILENEQQFLPIMDEIVDTLEAESSEGIRSLIYLEMFLAFFSILVLTGEFIFIFRPIYDELDEENEKLEKTIKELTHSKGELFKATQRFDLSIEAINAGIWDWYIPDGTEWWSDKFHSLLGYKPGEISASYSTFLYELLHPEDREKVEKAVKAHLEKRESYKLEIRMKAKDGHYRWFETVGQASWDYKGEPIRMVGSIIDIEEKKQFESQLSSDEQVLRIQKEELEKALTDLSEIQKVARIGMWEVDLETMTAHWSDEVYRIHEVPNGIEIKVEDGINYYREDYRPIIQKAINEAIEQKKSWDVECVLVTALGNEIWVRAVGFPVFKDDKPVALRGLFMNISEERLENMKQLENSTKLSLVLETSGIGIWEWGLATQELTWDEQMFKIYDVEQDEFISTYESYSNAVFDEDLPVIEKELELAIKNRSILDSEFRIKRKDGTIAYIIVKGKVLEDEFGNPIKMIGLNLDITDQINQKSSVEKRERFAELLQILPRAEESESQKIKDMLEVVTKSIGMQTGLVSRIESEKNLYRVVESYSEEGEIPIGTEFDFDTTYCHIPFNSEVDLIAISSMGASEYKDHPCYCTFNNEAYIGTTIYRGTEQFGMLSFSSKESVEPFTEDDKELIKSVAASVSHLITLQYEKQQAELVFRSIFNNTFNFTGLLEPDGTLIEANKSALDFGGFSLEDARGLNFADAPWWSLSEETIWKLREAIKKCASGEFIRYDADVVGGDGKVITIDFSMAPIFNEQGEVIYLVPEGRDISERIELEKEIAENSLRLIEAQEIGKIGNWNWDMEEDKLTWSDQNYKVFGQKNSFKPTFESLMELTHPEDREPFKEDVENAIKENSPHDFIHRIVLSGGKEIRYIHERGKVYYNKKGKPYRMAGTSQDVTGQLLKELELKEKTELLELSKKQLQTFISNAPVAVAMVDEGMNYIAASNKWYKDYGLKQKNIVGQNHYDIFPEIKKNEQWLDDHKRALSGEELSSDRDKFVRDDGSIQWISWKILPWYDEPGEIGGLIMYTADITNEVKYQEQLENLNEILEHQVQLRTEELNKANKEMESFSYSISHDLRAPLRAINGFADILEEDYRDSIDEEGRRLICIIKNSGVKMGQLIDDILAFSRLGRKAIAKEEVDMNGLFSDVIKDIKNEFDIQDIHFDIKELPLVMGDINLLKQVVINLVSNAVKYSSKKEKVKIEVTSTKKQGKYIIEVKDNGAGFDMKYHDKMFGVFQRLHTSDDFEGTGVGLAIVKRIVNKHGGEIWAESELEKGSSFYFSLPINK